MTEAQDLKTAIRFAVTKAIAEVGIETFKKTSMFMSNNRVEQDLKQAA
ncbi:hypothetical protein HFO84_32055 [Rhizobium leguminosarum]|nr:hypothetical protein [Rhizobium leguminosarum]MBY5481922.1 hypothetical protein [Rhizobium leguminosarum]